MWGRAVRAGGSQSQDQGKRGKKRKEFTSTVEYLNFWKNFNFQFCMYNQGLLEEGPGTMYVSMTY